MKGTVGAAHKWETCEVTDLDLNVRWYTGARFGRSGTEPAIQFHKAAENTVILRQSMAESYEAPFLYLLFGEDRALLLDTGATTDASKFPLRETIDALIEAWLVRHPKEGYELIVAHSHAHGDHVAADTQFADRALTQVVGHSVEEVFEFFWSQRSGEWLCGTRSWGSEDQGDPDAWASSHSNHRLR